MYAQIIILWCPVYWVSVANRFLRLLSTPVQFCWNLWLTTLSNVPTSNFCKSTTKTLEMLQNLWQTRFRLTKGFWMSLQGECSGWPNINKTSRKCGTNLQIHPRGPLLNQPSTITLTWLESVMEAARKYSQKALTYYSWYFGACIRYWGHCLHSQKGYMCCLLI